MECSIPPAGSIHARLTGLANLRLIFSFRYIMPGIAGVIAKSVSREDKSKVDLMVQSLVHEPTYTSGSLMDGNLGIAVGWTSHLGSFSDCCPIWNENRDVCLVFSGENLAEPGVAAELKAKGHAFSPDDASFLVHWYDSRQRPVW